MRRAEFRPSRLSSLRRRAGLSRERVAMAIGRSYQMLAAYEQGRVKPPLDVLERIAEALGCDPREFFEEELEAAAV